MACEYLLALVVAAICNCGELVDTHLCTGKLRHRRQLITINAVIGNDVRNDQMVLRVNRRLDVVADDSRSSCLHRTGIRIRERYLSVGCRVELDLDLLEVSHLFLQGRNLVLQSLCPDLRDCRLLNRRWWR